MATTTAVRIDSGRSERWRWLLFPLGLIALGYSLLALLGGLAGLITTIGSATSDAPVSVSLHADQDIASSVGRHFYSGTPYIPDGYPVTATAVQAEVAGLDPATRIALGVGPALWALTTAAVGTGISITLMRLRATTSRSAARPALAAAGLLAVGSTAAQVVSAYAAMRLGHVAYITATGPADFSGIGPATFDLTPLGFAAALLVVVLLIRRGERIPMPHLEDVPA